MSERCVHRIYNLCSERAYDPANFMGRAVRYPFDDHNPPPLDLIGAFCTDVDDWLGAHPDNVISVHCKAGKGRTGCLIAAYFVHCGMFADPEEALAFFGRRRTWNSAGVTIPSQMRWVHYYSHILHHGPSPARTLRLMHIRFVTVPAAETGGWCAPSVEVRLNNRLVFALAKAAPTRIRRFRRPAPCVDIDLSSFDICLRDNVRLQFLHHKGASVAAGRAGGAKTKLCHLWFHTAYVSDFHLCFSRGAVDKANKVRVCVCVCVWYMLDTKP